MVDKLGFGGAALTSMGNLNEILRLLNFAYDKGITHFDTAPFYGKGYSEIIYGKFIQDKRDNITITTKFGIGAENNSKKILLQPLLFANYWGKKILLKKSNEVFNSAFKGLNQRIIEKKEIELSFIKSIKNLNVSYIDYFLLHEGIPSFLTDEAFDYLSNLKKNGDVLKIGIATPIDALLNLEDAEINKWDVLQYEGFDSELKLKLKNKFPKKEHFHHSCFALRDLKNINDNEQDSMTSNLLSKSVLENLGGKIIFSSRNKNRISENIEAVNKLINL